MVQSLAKYKTASCFKFNYNDSLSKECNAPKDKSGVYLIYADKELIYIGRSGRKDKNGNIKHRKDGLYGRFVKGKQFGDRRTKTWPAKIKEEGIKEFSVHWFVTYDDIYKDFPNEIEYRLINEYKKQFGNIPRWNNKG